MFSQNSSGAIQAVLKQPTKGNAVIVRIWHSGFHGGRDVGHVSMEFGDTYISFWPEYDERKLFTLLNLFTLAYEKKKGKFKPSYYHDVIAEKRIADETIYLYSLDINEMLKIFSAVKASNPTWFIGSNIARADSSNCSATVMKILQAGGILKLLSDKEKQALKSNRAHAPWDTIKYVRSAGVREDGVFLTAGKLKRELDYDLRPEKMERLLRVEFNAYLENYAELAKKNNLVDYHEVEQFSSQPPVIVRSWLRKQGKNHTGKISIQIDNKYFFYNKKGIYKGSSEQHLAQIRKPDTTTYFYSLDSQKISKQFDDMQKKRLVYLPIVGESNKYYNSASFAAALLAAGGMDYTPSKWHIDGTLVNKAILRAKINELKEVPNTSKLDLELNKDLSDIEKMAVMLITRDACREKCFELDAIQPPLVPQVSEDASTNHTSSSLRRNSITNSFSTRSNSHSLPVSSDVPACLPCGARR